MTATRQPDGWVVLCGDGVPHGRRASNDGDDLPYVYFRRDASYVGARSEDAGELSAEADARGLNVRRHLCGHHTIAPFYVDRSTP